MKKDQDAIDIAVELVAGGMTAEAAAKQAGCKLYLLRQILPYTEARQKLDGFVENKSAAMAKKYLEAKERALKGEPIRRIAPELGIHQETLYRWLRRIGIEPKLVRQKKIIAKIKAFRRKNEGVSQAETARALKMSRTTVRAYWNGTNENHKSPR